MTNLRLLLVASGTIATIATAGCDELLDGQKPSAQQRIERRIPVHRFTLVRSDGDVALDTQTGQICRTWDWVPTGKATKVEPDSTVQPQRSFGEFTPTCATIYKNFPSGDSPSSESLPEGQPAK
jgi:hypothetical protein